MDREETAFEMTATHTSDEVTLSHMNAHAMFTLAIPNEHNRTTSAPCFPFSHINTHTHTHTQTHTHTHTHTSTLFLFLSLTLTFNPIFTTTMVCSDRADVMCQSSFCHLLPK